MTTGTANVKTLASEKKTELAQMGTVYRPKCPKTLKQRGKKQQKND